MATYNQISYGSQGSDVTELQKLLNQNGYTLDTDGIFGSKTQAAVKDYQQKNNLSVDGIVGDNTWGALTKASTATPSTPTTTPTQTETKTPTFEYGAYTPSDTVAQAEALLQQQMAQKPGAYQSTWEGQLNDIIQQILNREQFSYDLNGDALYQQYKDQYVTQGKMAMMDTMGQAQAMTGGYGNSYAQSVGQQAYQAYLQHLNDVVPELYGMALDQHNQEGQALYDQAGLMAQMEDQEYGRYMDGLNAYYNELDYLTGRYDTERDADYSKWYNDLMLQYQINRDNISDEQWQAQFDEAKRQYDQQYALSTQKTYKTYDYDGDKGTVNNGSLTTSQIKSLQTALGVTADGKWGPESQAAAEKKLGTSSADDAWTKYQESIKGRTEGNDPTPFSGSTYSEAAAYLKANGKSTGGLMNQAEWQRHKNNNNSAGGEHEASSYKEYLAAYIYGVMN